MAVTSIYRADRLGGIACAQLRLLTEGGELSAPTALHNGGLILPNLDKNTLHLWCAYPDDVLENGLEQACLALLSADEHSRWQSFRFDKHRREYLATRALVRTALSHYHPLPPAAWRFPRNTYGKPAADPDCGLRFNLSNSPGLVVCLIAQGYEVGVDAEPHGRASGILELASEVFSPLELADLQTLSGPQKLDRALSLWTLKEAYVKARGMGLSLALDKFSFVFDSGENIRLEFDPRMDDDPVRWRFALLDHAGHRIALMVERAGIPDLKICEARPLLASPTALLTRSDRWFPNLLMNGSIGA